VEISSTRAAIEAFYEVYVDNCAAHRIVPLPIDFVLSERDRAEAGFAVALCRHRGEVVGGRLLVAQDGVARIVEGATRRAARGLGAEELLTAAAVAWGAEQGASTLDYGITEPSADGLRAFKRRMGFVHTRPVVELQAMAVRAPAPPAPDRPAFLPAREDIALLERCNFACGFCYREPWVPELEVEAIHRRLAEVAARGNVGIAFSGGEPTLRAELPALVAHARELGITDIQLHTNGWRTAEPGYAAALAKAGLGSAMVSLHSHHAEGFAAITRTRSGAFERTLAGIDALRQAGVYTLLSHVVNALNYTELSAYFRFVAARFPKAEVFLFFVYPSVKGRQHPELYPRLSDVEPHWVRGLQEARRLGVAVTVDSLAGLPLCFMRGFEGASRYAYAHAQEAATDGRVDDHRVKAPEMRQGRACGQCRHSQTCPGFWSEYLDAHGDHELVPVP
jgi:pyruvate-formate lyase-activating enzyme